MRNMDTRQITRIKFHHLIIIKERDDGIKTYKIMEEKGVSPRV